ncbi:serine/threonine-protein kinase [Polyangium sp. y55x31]|uniref:serine/threonine-protein kinase n=1 Tax=Polyangium sp. y55x31 TaxID=3042688 RepID=UPI002482EFE7|nr:serine/threonine-protein kinase [Polyangium sp. y55x31]MDI1475660.1 serine/threonine-protein kinase [Polyangium sp. y55x31]
MATCPTCRTQYPDDISTCANDGVALVPDDTLGPVEPPLAAGTIVGEYRIEGKLGEGGFGAVYRAVHPVIGKAAAIKVLSREFSGNPQIVSRFVAEARAVNQIRHRNIIDIFSFGVLDDGRQYYVMELLEGLTLDAFLRQRGRIPPEEAIPILAKVARALDAAHAAGIAHRDLKPENIFLVYDEDTGLFPKLLDFGIAKLLGDSAGAHHKTRTGMAMGTPLYMSPEQCRGKNVDQRTDIYSFGIVAHELLTGRLPFEAEDTIDLLIKQTSAPAPPMSTVCPDLPAALDAPVLHMLEKDPARRPRTVGEAIEAIAAAARGAGIEVKTVVSRPQPGQGSIRVVTDPSADQGKTEAMAVTQGMPSESTKPSAGKTELALQTSTVGEGERKGRGGSQPLLVAGLAVALLAAVAFGVVVMRRPADEGAHAAPSANVAAPTIEITKPIPSAPAVVPASNSLSPDAPPAAVKITVDTRVPGVEVFLGTKRLGAAPGPIEIPRSTSEKLVFKAKGYIDLPREIPTEDGTLVVELKPLPRGPVYSKDVENPFKN